MSTAIELNIINLNTESRDWADHGQLDEGAVSRVMEQGTAQATALNSLPTPYARFYVAAEAFRRCHEEYLNPGVVTKEAGRAYRQIVSDVLDVYELLWRTAYHNNTFTPAQSISVQAVPRTDIMEALQATPKLRKSLDTYKDDIAASQFAFVVYNDSGKQYLLATTSPLTGFVTPPDLDRAADGKHHADQYYDRVMIGRKNGGQYFHDVKLFEQRDADFKNYMYHILGTMPDGGQMKEICEYIRAFSNDADITTEWNVATASVRTTDSEPLTAGPLKILQNAQPELAGLLTDTIFRLPYRIESAMWQTLDFQNDDPVRQYDYLLPLTAAALKFLASGQLILLPAQSRNNGRDIKITLQLGSDTYSRTYAANPITARDGSILDFAADGIALDVARFPVMLSAEDNENKWFAFLLAIDPAADGQFDSSLAFFDADGKVIPPSTEPGAAYGVKEPDKADAAVYHVFGRVPEAVQLSVGNATAMLIPRWDRKALGTHHYRYAIDLGTTNTFVARTRVVSAAEQLPSPAAMSPATPFVATLAATPDEAQHSLLHRLTSAVPVSLRPMFRQHFAPLSVDGGPMSYRFPTRTAVCAPLQSPLRARLFSTHSIAFFYGHEVEDDVHRVLTDIKWSGDARLLRLFVRELLLLVKSDVLAGGGKLDETEVVWFRPLAFAANARALYERVWREECARVLTINPQTLLHCYTESEAPYHYLVRCNALPATDRVAVIDIGGGSTDYVFFDRGVPQLSSSVHFGCNVLWGNGSSAFAGARDNGVFRRYADRIKFGDQRAQRVYDNMLASDKEYTTTDIVNFWLAASGSSDIARWLHDDFKPLFVFHLVSVVYYMSVLLRSGGVRRPQTVAFSGNGSRYIDRFISSDAGQLGALLSIVFDAVFGVAAAPHVVLPAGRKAATCYGGLYRDSGAPLPPAATWHGVAMPAGAAVDAATLRHDRSTIATALEGHYATLAQLYDAALTLLKRTQQIDGSVDLAPYRECARRPLRECFDKCFNNTVQGCDDADTSVGSLFFLPLPDRVLELTNCSN